MNLKWRKWIFLVVIGLVPILAGCNGCDKKKHVAPPPAPSAPLNLSAALISRTQIDLSWKDNSTIEKGFYVYRKATPNYSKIAQLDPNTTSYSDSSLDSKGTYWYKVTAYNDGGESDFSNEAVVKMVEILDYDMEESLYNVDLSLWRTRIVGNVKNHTNQTLRIKVGGRFFDFNNVEVGRRSTVLPYVNAGETRPYETSFIIGKRIERVDAWVVSYH